MARRCQARHPRVLTQRVTSRTTVKRAFMAEQRHRSHTRRSHTLPLQYTESGRMGGALTLSGRTWWLRSSKEHHRDLPKSRTSAGAGFPGRLQRSHNRTLERARLCSLVGSRELSAGIQRLVLTLVCSGHAAGCCPEAAAGPFPVRECIAVYLGCWSCYVTGKC